MHLILHSPFRCSGLSMQLAPMCSTEFCMHRSLSMFHCVITADQRVDAYSRMESVMALLVVRLFFSAPTHGCECLKYSKLQL